MTGAEFLDFICGSTTQTGLLEKNVNDTKYRVFMLNCLNLTIKDIQNKQTDWHWRFLEKTATFNTVADQENYALSTIASDIDTHKIVKIYDKTNDLTYKFVPYEQYKRLIADPSNYSGYPEWWSLWSEDVLLWPVPASVVSTTIDYIQLITALTDAAVSCEIPAKYDNLVIAGALKKAYKLDPELGQETTQEQVFDKYLNDMMLENAVVIDETYESESHRTKLGNRRLIDGEKSILFPLA